jgi:hypothetical protein
MATNKNTTVKTTAAKDSSNLPKAAYIRLRTILDALEISALRYCMIGTNAAEAIKRAKELEALLMPIVTRMQNNVQRGCPDGYFDCGGCCVCYPCISEMTTPIET